MLATTDSPRTSRTRRRTGPFTLEASDITGTHRLQLTDVDPATPAGVVASGLAARMLLPESIPWVLRDELNGAYLADDQPIGDQLNQDLDDEVTPKVSLTPRAHLGGAR